MHILHFLPHIRLKRTGALSSPGNTWALLSMSALLLNLDTALSAPMTYSTTAFCQMGTTISVAKTCTPRKLAFTAAELLMSISSCLSSFHVADYISQLQRAKGWFAKAIWSACHKIRCTAALIVSSSFFSAERCAYLGLIQRDQRHRVPVIKPR